MSFALHPARELVKFIDILHCLTYGGVMFETVSDTCRGPFLESPDNISGPESCFMFTVFLLEIKVSIILKMIQ